MTEHNDLERKISKAFKNATPNVLDAVLRDCENMKGQSIMTIERKTNWVKRAVAVAAAIVLVLGLGVGIATVSSNNAVASVVSLDVNPSIEIKVNKNERVLQVVPLNDDGVKVIGDMDFKGSDIDVAINALIGSMLREGYLNDLANSILISVDGDDSAKNAELQARLAQEIDKLLNTDDFSGSVLSQTVTHDTELDTLAEQYGITAGKAQLIRQITSQNTHYTFEDLAKLTINELNLISTSNGTTLENVTSTGSASDKKYIGAEVAKQSALAHAGVNEADIRGYECELDYERGTMVYEIEFHANGYEYDYDINATDGSVVNNTRERDDDYYKYNSNNNTQSSPSASENTQQGNDTQQSGNAQQSSSKTETTSYISREEARAAAINHAGVNDSDVREFECEFDHEDGLAVYEIDFEVGQYDYDYEINAETGAVVRHSKKFDDDNIFDDIEDMFENNDKPASSQNTEFIGSDAAKSAALKHAGVSASDARGIECELDRADDLFEKDHYDVEFSSGGYDYEYEIDAQTGEVLRNEKERDD